MSEKLLKILLNELTLVRLKCTKKDCGAVAEITVDQLATMKGCACPVCQTSYRSIMPKGEHDALTMLGLGLQTLAKDMDRFQVEFVIPDRT